MSLRKLIKTHSRRAAFGVRAAVFDKRDGARSQLNGMRFTHICLNSSESQNLNLGISNPIRINML